MAPKNGSEQTNDNIFASLAQGFGTASETTKKLYERATILVQDWQRILNDEETRHRFQELFGTVGDRMSLVNRTLSRLPMPIKTIAYGGTAGVIIGFLLGGGGVGIAAFGSAIGVPIIAITGLIGAFAGERVGRELEFYFEQWVRATERRLQTFQQIEDHRVGFESVRGMAHWTVFEQAFRNAQRQLCIRSGFIGANVVDDCFIGRLEAALERGVDIIIEYGTEWSVGAVVNSMSRRAAIRRLDALQKRAIDRRLRGKLYHGATRTHVKELAVDEDYAIIGSFNWLSNRSGNRHESSVKVHSAALASEIYRDALSSLNHVGAI